MIEIGQIKFVQIQTKPLKINEKTKDSYYDPAGIQQVQHLRLTANGVIGIKADGAETVDIHNATHPFTRNNGNNGITIGFTSHYKVMHDRYGDHVKEGIAGENIIVETEQPYHLKDFKGRIALQSVGTGELIHCTVYNIVAPCREFSGFCAGRNSTEETFKTTLQFLGEGQRGFKIILAEPTQRPIISAGDWVYLVD